MADFGGEPEAFRAEAREWLEANVPASLRGRAEAVTEAFMGGGKPDGDMDLWRQRIGEKGWGKMFPEEEKNPPLTWSKYRDTYVKHLIGSQLGDGSWPAPGGWGSGPIYATAVNCVIMQLDNNCLPVFTR